ncbi:diol dehydratase small subunit [Clostridium cochlearium]|jgi:propanediol dehydratase small subunit|uniref:Protein DhaC n=1 Tax=Clostridium cochlearium TaxID=1494 RepID=A0A239ZPQ5_CLOCO|nr:diol dehydratase small subunit [Clostridium cochlearium]MBE6064083.1 diol dehydratase small subunit [Clostridium cochlearium]MCG4580577.1 diol dehydratase small subunit [Clostridium cochlearium]MCR1971274.1 diol dehydratase small subunit [Clostridium cochlearium]MDU1443419.1 diol dehydratase small subunit [Clostridium cochlearium]NMA57523.1 diol dehydratase small subunit [Clostridium cochlearium]
MDNTLIEQIVNEVLKSMNSGDIKVSSNIEEKVREKITSSNNKLSKEDYPLLKNKKEILNTKTGKNITEITMEKVINGEIIPDDIKITPEVLIYQAQIAETVERYQFARNLRRAAELTAVPDERVLEIYNALRPYRSTKQELLDIADELEGKYNAKLNASLVRQAVEVYEKRERLKE